MQIALLCTQRSKKLTLKLCSAPAMEEKNTKSYIVYTGLSLLGLFCVFFFAGFLNTSLPFELKTIDSKSVLAGTYNEGEKDKQQIAFSLLNEKRIRFKDSTIFLCTDSVYVQSKLCRKDTSIKKLLLIGDSQTEYLKSPVYNYCINNNYELVATVVWYSSTTVSWATSDTLDQFLEKYDPDFVIIALGLNELFIPNFESRRKHVRAITNTIADRKIPYYWIGPAAWTKDQGIVNVLNEELGNSFYPSQKLVLKRAADKRHPSRDGSKVWFDSVAVAMTKSTPLSFVNKVSDYKEPQQSPTICLGLTKHK
ncbi:hypothetical protein BH11BAC7_BH11BAC7_02170 [soil metagenome]